ncbi:MAG: tRNA1(Val) (adenine(37)-N6)-methyltransferase [Bacteroidota bacterium]|jgi:tRNA1Val (adenine37-N6)-methyltransferase
MFAFKKFNIKQQANAMKVGTDSVVLGALVQIPQTNLPYLSLDIGTGTGLLALMLAQKGAPKIDAVELEPIFAQEAQFNFNQSEWAARILLFEMSIQQFAASSENKYELIISNPPYYIEADSFKLEEPLRATARYTQQLSFDVLAQCVSLLLTEQGKFWLILPNKEAALFQQQAQAAQLYLQQTIEITPKQDAKSNRVVMCYGKTSTPMIQSEIVLYQSDGMPTELYKNLTRDFYIGKQFS